MLPCHLCRFAARSPHHLSTRVLQPCQVKLWPSPHATPLAAMPHSLPRPLTHTAHATTHACKRASAHSSVGRLLIPSPTRHCILLLHTHAHAFTFLCSHCRRAHLTADRPLHRTNHPTNEHNGSGHPPPCFPTTPPSLNPLKPAAFQFFPAGHEQYPTASPSKSAAAGESLAPFFLKELP
jgi:hypothetical protein